MRVDSGKNFLDEYVKFASDLTDAPVEFHRFVGYSVASATINNNVFFKFGKSRVYPNLWIILLGSSGLFRKSTSMNIGKEILSEFNKDLVLPNEFSQEKILEVLAQQSQGTFFFSEFLSFMGLLQRDYMAGTKAFFTEMYDCPFEYTRQTIKQNITIKNPFINIVAATTIDWFLDTIKEGDIAGGFLARFLMVPGLTKLKSIALPDEVNDNESDRVRMLLYEFSDRKGQIQFSPEAKHGYESWYHKFEKSFHSTDSKIHPFLIRLTAYLIKLSMLEAICKKEDTISLESFKTAEHYINWVQAQLNNLSGDLIFTKTGRSRLKVLRIIKDSGTDGIQHHWLLKMSNLELKELTPILETLAHQRQIVSEYIQQGQKRGSHYYWFIDYAKRNPETLALID